MPDAAPGKKGKLRLAGAVVPVEVVPRKKGADFTLELRAHGSVFDSESYVSTEDAFSLRYAALEHYAPPIDLVRFPMNVGDEWEWTGTMTTADEPRKAKAKLTSSIVKSLVQGVSRQAVKVDVALTILPNGPGDTIERTLSFWFVEGKGIVRREFGTESIREPAEE
jgi:hypothetical protein